MTHVDLRGGELIGFLRYFSIRSSWRTTPTLVCCWLEQTAIHPMEVRVFPLCLCQNISRSWKIHLQEDVDINVYWAFKFPNTVGGNLVIYKLFCWWHWRETEKKKWGVGEWWGRHSRFDGLNCYYCLWCVLQVDLVDCASVWVVQMQWMSWLVCPGNWNAPRWVCLWSVRPSIPHECGRCSGLSNPSSVWRRKGNQWFVGWRKLNDCLCKCFHP